MIHRIGKFTRKESAEVLSKALLMQSEVLNSLDILGKNINPTKRVEKVSQKNFSTASPELENFDLARLMLEFVREKVKLGAGITKSKEEAYMELELSLLATQLIR